MAKKTKVTQQRAREEQWRRRVEQQSRQGVGTTQPDALVEDDFSDVEGDSVEYIQADIQPMPSGVETSARATTTTAPRTPRATSVAPATPKRTAAAARASRLAFQQTMSLEEEMTYVRSDIRQLIILSALCFVILIALAFVIQ